MELHYADADDYAALYVDGLLVTVGNSYIVEGKAFGILGVRQVQDDAFMRGQTEREGAARSLAEVDSYRAERERRKEAAAKLRKEAAKLLAEAAALEGERG